MDAGNAKSASLKSGRPWALRGWFPSNQVVHVYIYIYIYVGSDYNDKYLLYIYNSYIYNMCACTMYMHIPIYIYIFIYRHTIHRLWAVQSQDLNPARP